MHMTDISKITRMQNHDRENVTLKDLWAWAGLRIYAIMLPSSDFSVAHSLFGYIYQFHIKEFKRG